MSLIPVPDLTRRNKILMAVVLIVSILIPALFWQSVWFGRSLSPEQIEQQLAAPASAREIQHALALVEQLIRAGDDQASRYYPAISRLSTHEREEVRTLAAWVMGQGTSSSLFRETLLQMLEDSHPLVRRNAALGLVRFSDRSGLAILRLMLEPFPIQAPAGGVVRFQVGQGDVVSPGSVIARLESDRQESSIPAQLSSRVFELLAEEGQPVAGGQSIATLAAPSDHVWEALRALYLVGETEDLPAVRSFIDNQNYSSELRDQARLTAERLETIGESSPSEESDPGKESLLPRRIIHERNSAKPFGTKSGFRLKASPQTQRAVSMRKSRPSTTAPKVHPDNSPGQRPGDRWGRIIAKPFRLPHTALDLPRALPWAVIFLPFQGDWPNLTQSSR